MLLGLLVCLIVSFFFSSAYVVAGLFLFGSCHLRFALLWFLRRKTLQLYLLIMSMCMEIDQAETMWGWGGKNQSFYFQYGIMKLRDLYLGRTICSHVMNG